MTSRASSPPLKRVPPVRDWSGLLALSILGTSQRPAYRLIGLDRIGQGREFSLLGRAFSATIKGVGSRDKQRVHTVGDGRRSLHGRAALTETVQILSSGIDLRFHARHISARIAVAFCDWDMVSSGQDRTATRPLHGSRLETICSWENALANGYGVSATQAFNRARLRRRRLC